MRAQGVNVNLHCWLDLESLGDTHLWMPARVFQRSLRKEDKPWIWTEPIIQWPDWFKAAKEEAYFTSLCLLTVGTRWPPTQVSVSTVKSHFCLDMFPFMRGSTLKLWGKTNSSLLKLLMTRYLVMIKHEEKKSWCHFIVTDYLRNLPVCTGQWLSQNLNSGNRILYSSVFFTPTH